MFMANIMGSSRRDPHLPKNGEVKEPVLIAPLRICSNLFPPSNTVATPPTRSCSASEESSLGSLDPASSSTLLVESPYAQGPLCPLGPVAFSTMPPAVESLGSFGLVASSTMSPTMPVQSPYAPIQADQSILKSEMSSLDHHHEYVEYGEEWYGEADIKDNLLLQCFQRNIEAKVKNECYAKGMLKVSWFDDEAVRPMEDSLFLRCHQFLKDESKPDDEEEEEKECDLVKVSRWRRGGRSSCRRRKEEVGRICLRRKEDGGFEIKKEVDQEEEELLNADINHRHLVFGVDNCDVCPACQV